MDSSRVCISRRLAAWDNLRIGAHRQRESAQGVTTLLMRVRLLGQDSFAGRVVAAINMHLNHKDVMFKEGTVVDATILAA